jgi:aminoglycoside 6'-N-acetyltransferase I
MQIIDLPAQNQEMLHQAASLLVEGFKMHWPNAWPDLDAALAEVQTCLRPGRINCAAVDDEGILLGWVGASREYQGHAWELHPLVVHPDRQGQGIGRALVADLEERVRQAGGITLYLGSDDEDGMTSLSNVDLYPDVIRHIARLRNLRRHPYEFYQKLGYAIVGVIPDANGPGKPDIIMAKRVGDAYAL